MQVSIRADSKCHAWLSAPDNLCINNGWPQAKNKYTVPYFIVIQKNFHYFRLNKAGVAHFFVNGSMPIKILDSVILGSSNKISNLLGIFNPRLQF